MGVINGFFLFIYQVLKKPRKRFLKGLKIRNDLTLLILIEWLFTLFVIVFSWIVFRSDSVGNAFSYIGEIFSSSLFSVPEFTGMSNVLATLFFIFILFSVEWKEKDQEYPLAALGKNWYWPFRYATYYAIIILIIWFGGNEQQFIYFQF